MNPRRSWNSSSLSSFDPSLRAWVDRTEREEGDQQDQLPQPPAAQAKSEVRADAIRPLHVHFPDEALADMKRRTAATRWPEREIVSDQSQVVQLATVQALARYWTSKCDWRRGEPRTRARKTAEGHWIM